jgi:hypothetical protein
MVTYVVKANMYTFRLIVYRGFFKVVIMPFLKLTNKQWPLTPVFNMGDLYLINFLPDNIWHVFKNTKHNGSSHLEHPSAYELHGSYNSNQLFLCQQPFHHGGGEHWWESNIGVH